MPPQATTWWNNSGMAAPDYAGEQNPVLAECATESSYHVCGQYSTKIHTFYKAQRGEGQKAQNSTTTFKSALRILKTDALARCWCLSTVPFNHDGGVLGRPIFSQWCLC